MPFVQEIGPEAAGGVAVDLAKLLLAIGPDLLLVAQAREQRRVAGDDRLADHGDHGAGERKDDGDAETASLLDALEAWSSISPSTPRCLHLTAAGLAITLSALRGARIRQTPGLQLGETP